MPIYEYKCENCGEVFEVRQNYSDEPVTVHEKCGGRVEKLISAPSFNFNPEQSVRSMNEMDAFLKATGARLWINHDSEQSKTIPKAPAYIE